MLNNTKEYNMTRAIDVYEEFGVTAQEDAVETRFTACIKADGNGWFTIESGAHLYQVDHLRLLHQQFLKHQTNQLRMMNRLYLHLKI